MTTEHTAFSPLDYDTGSVITYRNFLDQEVQVMVMRQEYHRGQHGFIGCEMGAAEDPAGHPVVWGFTSQIISVDRR